jgi:hypothetical protein
VQGRLAFKAYLTQQKIYRKSKSPAEIHIEPPKLMLEEGLPGQSRVNHGRPLKPKPHIECLILWLAFAPWAKKGWLPYVNILWSTP